MGLVFAALAGAAIAALSWSVGQPGGATTVTAADGRPMTVYAVTNPGSNEITVRHVITNAAGFRHQFDSKVPPNSTARFRLRDMPQVPSPFNGALVLSADRPFIATVVDFDIDPTGERPKLLAHSRRVLAR